MVLAVPRITSQPENNILQNFSDATAGRSQQLFYGMQTKDSIGLDYILQRDAGNSFPTIISDGSSFDIDFDITINKPTIFAGIGSIDVHFGITNGTGTQTTVSIDCEIIHYDGSTETVLASVDSVEITNVGSTSQKHKLKFTMPRKLFKIGDIFRLNIKGNNSDSQGGEVLLHLDSLTAGNELKLWMPIVNLE